MANVWGYWDCLYCGTKAIRGDETSCPHCGSGRDKDVKFYMQEGILEYVPPEQTSIAQNWICSYCGYQNAAELTQCSYCGASQTESEKKYFYSQSDSPDLLDSEESSSENYGYSEMVLGHMNKRKLIIFTVLSLIIAFLVWLFIPVQREMTIDHFSWDREIQVEQMQTVDEDGWSLPSAARLHYTSQEIRTYDQVIDHYETKTRQVPEQVFDHYETVVDGYQDLGNGQFQEITRQKAVYRTEYKTETYQEPVYKSVPVYDTKYYYEIDKWIYSYSTISDGMDKEPYWEIPKLKEHEREGKREEHYYIHCVYDETAIEYEIDYETWNLLEESQSITFKTFRFNHKMIGEIDYTEK